MAQVVMATVLVAALGAWWPAHADAIRAHELEAPLECPGASPHLAAGLIRVSYEHWDNIGTRRWFATMDTGTLSADDACMLRTLVSEARFLELPAEIAPPRLILGGPTTRITVEVNGQRHTVVRQSFASPEEVPYPELEPLLRWLGERAVEPPLGPPPWARS